MTIDKIIVTVLGVIVSVFIYWFFLGKKDDPKNGLHDHH